MNRKQTLTEEIRQSAANVKRAGGYTLDASLFREGACTSELLANALAEHGDVEIPYLPFPVLLDRPIVLKSGCSLKVNRKTVMRMLPGAGGCMVRNEHVSVGSNGPDTVTPYDENIAVEGGIWADAQRSYCPNDPNPAMAALKDVILGVVFFSGARNFSVRDMTLVNGSPYGVLLTRCDHFLVEKLVFDRYQKDGVHVNGPTSCGVIRDLEGETGDDFVALNAWDWDTSAVHFGPIHHMLIEDLRANQSEFRLLPGRKRFPNGRTLDCDIHDVVLEGASGIYNYKLYNQPNCHNKALGKHDCSENAGDMREVYLSGLTLDRFPEAGFGTIRVAALIEICADCEDVYVKDVTLGMTREAFEQSGTKLALVGPKSETWKLGKSDPNEWAELFDTDVVCRVKRLHVQGVRFADGACEDVRRLIEERHLAPNPDYPNTTPAGGTGYGTVEQILTD